MRIIVQRVSHASVQVDGRVVGSIQQGLLVLLGVAQGDTEKTGMKLAEKVANLRIFADEQQKMNRSLLDIKGQALVVSQFTLLANLSRGRRPFFGNAESPERAQILCENFCQALRNLGIDVATGEFGAMMRA